MLSGYRVYGSVNCSEGGHQLTNLFLRKLLTSYSNFIEIDFENLDQLRQEFKISENKIAVNA